MVCSIIYSLIIGFFFVGPNHSYSVLLPDGTQLVQVDTLENNMINHTFVGLDKGSNMEYSLSFSIVDNEPYNLMEDQGVEKYEQDCNCKVEQSMKVEFTTFKGVKYSISKSVEGTKLGGEVYISEIQNGKSINVVSMALYNQRKHVESNLKPILNTLVLNL